jgi:hypothetical protein
MCVCTHVSCSVVSNWPLCEFYGRVYCDILSIFLFLNFVCSWDTRRWIKSKSKIRSILTHHRQNPTEIIYCSLISVRTELHRFLRKYCSWLRNGQLFVGVVNETRRNAVCHKSISCGHWPYLDVSEAFSVSVVMVRERVPALWGDKTDAWRQSKSSKSLSLSLSHTHTHTQNAEWPVMIFPWYLTTVKYVEVSIKIRLI